MLVVDDAVLLDVLAGVALADVQGAAERGEVHTTGCWYDRLSRALRSEPMVGALSRRLASLTPERRERVATGLVDLPAEIGLALDADLVVLTDHPALRTGAADLSLRYQ